MSEIQWLVDILMNHKLAPGIRERFIARIGEVEARLGTTTYSLQGQRVFTPTTAQVPSMQRIMDETATTPQPVTRKVIPQEVITSTTNGGSTKGPRKW